MTEPINAVNVNAVSVAAHSTEDLARDDAFAVTARMDLGRL